ncbi:MAG: AI-2E family transporter [Thermoanaerobaculia bacterium]
MAPRAPLSAPAPVPQRLQVSITMSSLFKILFVLLLAWAALKLWPGFLLLVISVLLAVTLAPTVAAFESRGLSRGLSVVLLAVICLVTFGLLGWFLFPPLTDQISSLLARLPHLKEVAARHLQGHEVVAKIVQQVFDLPTSPEVSAWMKRPMAWGTAAIEAVAALGYVFVFTFYLLADGKGLYAWLLAFVPRKQRPKLALMLPEVEQVVGAYVSGQLLTSFLFSVFVSLVLLWLGIPGIVPLALVAGIFDVVPVIGIVMSTVPAVLLALTVSPVKALTVLGLYLFYHLFETYVLVPKLYGKRLSLSPLAVLLALVVGGTLQGVIGAVLILPFVAAYPVIERHLLHNLLNPEVLRDHSALDGAEHDEKEDVQDAVMRGERHGPGPNEIVPVAESKSSEKK